MKKPKLVTALICFFLITLTGSVFAWAPQLDGRPEAFHPGAVRGYFIWHDNNGLHLRTTTEGQMHIFSGDIHTDGIFADVHGAQLEANDALNVGPEGHQMNFRFETAGGVDGIDFKVEGGEKVVFNLYMDGHEISPDEIYGGHGSWHPNSDSFQIFR
jgi:hypothetical protein